MTPEQEGAKTLGDSPRVDREPVRYLITFFGNNKALTKKERAFTLPQMAELIERHTKRGGKKELPLWKMAKFGNKRTDKHCLRNNENVEYLTGVMVEHDAGTMPFDEAVRRVRDAKLTALLYTTPSHTPDKPRWRAAFPFAGRLFPGGHENMVSRANALFGGVLSNESWVLSQPYYYGRVEGTAEHFQIKVVEGEFIDVPPEMPERPKVKGNGHADPKSKLEDLPKKWRELIQSGDASAYDDDQSDLVAAVTRVMVERDWPDFEIEAVLLDKTNGISAHIHAQDDPHRAVERIIKFIRTPPPDIAEVNQEYALILVGDKVAVLREMVTPEGKPGITLLTPAAFKQWMATRSVVVGEKRVPLADYWLRNHQQRRYESLLFHPEMDLPKHYNLWRGFTVEPRPGDCSKFLAHLRDNVCQGDEARYRWLLGWLADLFQHPASKPGTAVVLRGKQGTGKTKVGEVIGSLLGDHYALVSDPRYIVGRFNSHLVSCLLLHCDEAFWAGDHTAEGKLKDLVTGDYQFIEFKGKEAIRVRNFVRLLVTGNPEWLVPAGMEERRFAFFDMGEEHTQDHAYFGAIDAEMKNGGREALLHHLLHLDLSAVSLRAIPKTEGLLEQKIASLSPEQAWWFDMLQRGRLPPGCEETDTCPAQLLFDDYIQHANKQGINAKRRSIETMLGMRIRQMAPKGFRSFDGEYTAPETWQQVQTRKGGKVYRFPPLLECRKFFEKKIQQKVDWGTQDTQVNWRKGDEVVSSYEADHGKDAENIKVPF
jgi:hypothetical protein